MSPLSARKRLLIAESELNRARLAADLGRIVTEVRSLSDGVASLGNVASAVAGVAGLVQDMSRRPDGRSGSLMSWVRTAIDGVGVVTSLWRSIRRP